MQVDSSTTQPPAAQSTQAQQVQVSEVQTEDWQARVARKQKACRDKIPKEWLLPESITSELKYPLENHPNRLIEMEIPRRSGILSEREVAITENYTVAALLEALATSKLSALEVTLAFSKRACIAGQLTNCLTETYYDQAQERAKQLDAMKAEGKSVGPLHGLPISLKDSFKVTGSEATIGFVYFLDDVAHQNSPMVDLLLEQGAVVYVKTNIPQTMMTGDSVNNIFGRTLNPHNTFLGAGGSSGGEGALVAFRGSPLGVGTDIAGSIRIPSLCDGTYGFKPSASRIPLGGQLLGLPGTNFFLACAGPLANDMDALEIFSKAVIDAGPVRFTSDVLDIPWRDIKGPIKSKLKLGMVDEDPMYPLHPPIKRAMNEAVRLLQADGHEIIHLKPAESLVAEACEVAFALFRVMAAGPDLIVEGREPAVNSVVYVRGIMAGLPPKFAKEQASLEGIVKLAGLNAKRHEVAEAWRDLWNKYQFDAVLSPSAQHVAPPHDQFGIPAYTTYLNTLDYPACVIPFMKASKDLDPEPFIIQPGQYGPNYDPEAMSGAPCSIQVFTGRMRDEECLQAATIIDRCLNPKA